MVTTWRQDGDGHLHCEGYRETMRNVPKGTHVPGYIIQWTWFTCADNRNIAEVDRHGQERQINWVRQLGLRQMNKHEALDPQHALPRIPN